MPDLTVLIVGAGLGGLTLAQSLRGHLDADAINAAREVLPATQRAVFDTTAHHTEPLTTLLTTSLAVIKRLPTQDEYGTVWPAHDGPAHANVDRATLRQILLSGIGDAVHYGRRLERYESTEAGVTAFFADGSTMRGDVLVGADGIRSAVRRQRAPHCAVVDAGITAIYGRLPLAVAEPLVPTETLTDIFTIASDERKVFLGLGAVRFPIPPAEAARRFGIGTPIRDEHDYVVCIVGGRHEFFPNTNGVDLRDVAVATLGAWPRGAAELVRSADPDSFFPVEMSTSVPATLDTPVNVTFVGDAIHAMTPTLGRGANVAMRDATLLGRVLKKVADGQLALADALATYERDELTTYGFAVVREAARIGQQRMAQHPLG